MTYPLVYIDRRPAALSLAFIALNALAVASMRLDIPALWGHLVVSAQLAALIAFLFVWIRLYTGAPLGKGRYPGEGVLSDAAIILNLHNARREIPLADIADIRWKSGVLTIKTRRRRYALMRGLVDNKPYREADDPLYRFYAAARAHYDQYKGGAV